MRALLGPADVSDDRLASMVTAALGREATVTECQVEEVAYDLPALTTAARHWVRGTAATDTGEAEFAFFVKHVQSWGRSPFFAGVPPELREMAEASVPWRTEPLLYRSDLGERLPPGLTMAPSYGVFDLDEKSSAIWLGVLDVVPATWDVDHFARAGQLLGRLAASPRVAELADLGEYPWTVHDYYHGRLRHQVIPVLGEESLWSHPLFEPFAGIRQRLLDQAGSAQGLTEELHSYPVVTGHGDASPNNLLSLRDTDDIALIDFGFWGPRTVGFDLGQLLVGDIQLGRLPASLYPDARDAALSAYVEGLRAEGCDIPFDTVRRAHAIQVLLFTGLSLAPFDMLEDEPSDELLALCAERAELARHILDLVDAT